MAKPADRDIDVRALAERAQAVRARVLDAVWDAGGGHVGGALGAADLLVALYFRALRVDPNDPAWPSRDRVVLARADGALGLAAVLAERGFFGASDLFAFARAGHALGANASDRRRLRGVDVAPPSASGHGLGVAVGLALGAKLREETWRTVCLLTDADCYEGGTWEAAIAANALGVRRLVVVVDRSGMLTGGDTEDEAPLEPLAAKWRAFGWRVTACDGHDFKSLCPAIDGALASERPSVVVAETVKGRGVSFLEDDPAWHWGGFDEAAYARASADLLGKSKKRRLFGRGSRGAQRRAEKA